MEKFLVMRINAENVNAKSGDILFGAPSISSVLGLVHSIERNLIKVCGYNFIKFDGSIIVIHKIDLNSDNDAPYGDYNFHQKRFPLKKDGKPMAFINEITANVDISLVIKVVIDDMSLGRFRGSEGTDDTIINDLKQRVREHLFSSPFCSGRVKNIRKLELFTYDEDSCRNIMFGMHSGYALRDRTELLKQKEDNETSFDYIFRLTRPSYEFCEDEQIWKRTQQSIGRNLVPIEIGYMPIEKVTNSTNSTRANNEAYVVESVYSLGEWVKAYKITFNDLDNFYWKYVNKNDVFLFKDFDFTDEVDDIDFDIDD